MYSDAEIESAIAAGAFSKDAADALRAHCEHLRMTPHADEEQFRLITSFNDIFVVIAGILVLVAAGWIGGSIVSPLGAVFVAGTSWTLAEFFTRKRRMALPSIVFVGTFVYSVGAAIGLLLGTSVSMSSWGRSFGVLGYGAMLAAAWFHWQRFKVPITVAMCVVAVAGLIFSLITSVLPSFGQGNLIIVLVLGLGVFAFALWWDMQDRERKSSKADVAFWLHLSASPLIVHPIFALLGFNFLGLGDGGGPQSSIALLAALAVMIYACLGLVALVIDRRALLVSALAYVLAAVVYLFGEIGVKGVGFAVAALIIGSALLMVSALWQHLRRRVLPLLPQQWQSLLPTVRAT
jgi:MFS family permease